MDPSTVLRNYSNSLKDTTGFICIILVLALFFNIPFFFTNERKSIRKVTNVILISLIFYILYNIYNVSHPIVFSLKSELFDSRWNSVKLSLIYNLVLSLFLIILIFSIISSLFR